MYAYDSIADLFLKTACPAPRCILEPQVHGCDARLLIAEWQDLLGPKTRKHVFSRVSSQKQTYSDIQDATFKMF